MSPVFTRHALALTVALVASLATSCARGPKVETEVYERPDGGVVVETLKLQATVTAINASTRQITLKPRHRDTIVLKADEAVANFGQIRIGDQVHVVLADQIAVTLIKAGAPQSVGAATGVALAPLGEKPAALMANTVELTGTIIGIDSHEHTVTLEFLDGSTREIKVAKHRDLSEIALGDSVRVTLTEAVAIRVETPKS